MENDANRGKKDELEEHSLPGTNQAGKGPGGSGDATSQRQEQLEEHNLPGTNQAGKGPGSADKPARTASED